MCGLISHLAAKRLRCPRCVAMGPAGQEGGSTSQLVGLPFPTASTGQGPPSRGCLAGVLPVRGTKLSSLRLAPATLRHHQMALATAGVRQLARLFLPCYWGLALGPASRSQLCLGSVQCFNSIQNDFTSHTFTSHMGTRNDGMLSWSTLGAQ